MSISDFSDMMPHTVLVTPNAGTYSDYGKPVDGTTTSYPNSRVKFSPHMIVDSKGSTVVAGGEIWLSTTDNITVTDKIEYDEATDVSPTTFTQLFPLKVDRIPDELGEHHVKIHFK